MKKIEYSRLAFAAIAAGFALGTPAVASASILFSDDFNTTGSSANYNTFITAGATGPSSDATFAYDYSALGIPSAPNTTDGSTLGLRLRVDNLQSSVGTVVGAVEISTKTLSLPTTYVVSADVWGNYIGGTSIAASGSNGSTGMTMGLGTAGTSIQYIAANDGFLTETFHDNGGGANQQFRVYNNGTHPNPTTVGASYWAAGTSATSASYTDPYYNFLTAHSAPSAQTTLSPGTQGGSTPVGVMGFAWHTMTLTQDGVNVTWAIDGHTITTVPDSAFTQAGGQISLGANDTGLTGSSAALNQLLNADIWDNLTVSSFTVPEPSSCSLLLLGGFAFLVRRFKK